MPKFIVERTVPKIGDLTPEKLHQLGDLARAALKSFGGRVQWLESFITEDKVYSILTAPDEATAQGAGPTTPDQQQPEEAAP